jgi:hypothetical protein
MGVKCWLRCGNQAKGCQGFQVIIQQLGSSVVLEITLLVRQLGNQSSILCIRREFFFIHDMGYDNPEV